MQQLVDITKANARKSEAEAVQKAVQDEKVKLEKLEQDLANQKQQRELLAREKAEHERKATSAAAHAEEKLTLERRAAEVSMTNAVAAAKAEAEEKMRQMVAATNASVQQRQADEQQRQADAVQKAVQEKQAAADDAAKAKKEVEMTKKELADAKSAADVAAANAREKAKEDEKRINQLERNTAGFKWRGDHVNFKENVLLDLKEWFEKHDPEVNQRVTFKAQGMGGGSADIHIYINGEGAGDFKKNDAGSNFVLMIDTKDNETSGPVPTAQIRDLKTRTDMENCLMRCLIAKKSVVAPYGEKITPITNGAICPHIAKNFGQICRMIHSVLREQTHPVAKHDNFKQKYIESRIKYLEKETAAFKDNVGNLKKTSMSISRSLKEVPTIAKEILALDPALADAGMKSYTDKGNRNQRWYRQLELTMKKELQEMRKVAADAGCNVTGGGGGCRRRRCSSSCRCSRGCSSCPNSSRRSRCSRCRSSNNSPRSSLSLSPGSSSSSSSINGNGNGNDNDTSNSCCSPAK